MNLVKCLEFFNPSKDDARIHIIGCGSVGSTLAENLARCGIKNMTLWDMDVVEEKNVHNQMFTAKDVGRPKVEALRDIIMEINPEIPEGCLILKPKGWQGQVLSGYVFLAVDSIEIRRAFVEKHMASPYIKGVFDIRTELTGAQHYAADWSDEKMKENLLKTMQFSHEEAAAETPTSACGVTLGIVTTVRMICGIAVNNYIRFTKGEGIWKFAKFEGFNNPSIVCF